ncbi:MAG: hypothetical protein AAF646_15965 [Pseudomonadota bacterium]
MANPSHTYSPCCRLRETLPQTRDEILALGDLVELGHDFEALALAGTQFEDALITTQNAGALIAGRGGYGALQTTGTSLRLSQAERRMDVRFLPTSAINLARATTPASAAPTSVMAMDDAGRVRHRIQVTSTMDLLVALSLPRRANCTAAPPLREGVDHNVVPLTAIRNARESWDQVDVAHHLNDFLFDGGVSRSRCLAHIGPNRAWRILPEIVPSFLDFLGRRRIGIARFVLGHGLMQSDVGILSDVRESDRVVVAREKQKSFALDLKEVASVWVTVCRQQWHLEFYDPQRAGVAVICADPSGNLATWRDLLCSLPRQTPSPAQHP